MPDSNVNDMSAGGSGYGHGHTKSLTWQFIVAASQIGLELGVLTQATAAALIATGLLSVLISPLGALSILRRAQPWPASSQPSAVRHQVQAES